MAESIMSASLEGGPALLEEGGLALVVVGGLEQGGLGTALPVEDLIDSAGQPLLGHCGRKRRQPVIGMGERDRPIEGGAVRYDLVDEADREAGPGSNGGCLEKDLAGAALADPRR